jgi:hypothetical protein
MDACCAHITPHKKHSQCSFGFPRVRIEAHLQWHRESIFSIGLEHFVAPIYCGQRRSIYPFPTPALLDTDTRIFGLAMSS